VKMQIPLYAARPPLCGGEEKTRAAPLGMTVRLPWQKAMRGRTATCGEHGRAVQVDRAGTAHLGGFETCRAPTDYMTLG